MLSCPAPPAQMNIHRRIKETYTRMHQVSLHEEEVKSGLWQTNQTLVMQILVQLAIGAAFLLITLSIHHCIAYTMLDTLPVREVQSWTGTPLSKEEVLLDHLKSEAEISQTAAPPFRSFVQIYDGQDCFDGTTVVSVSERKSMFWPSKISLLL